MPGCKNSMLSGEVADLNHTGTPSVASTCDNRLKPYRRGGLLMRVERQRAGVASVGGA